MQWIRIGPNKVCSLPLGVEAEHTVHNLLEYFFLPCHILFSQSLFLCFFWNNLKAENFQHFAQQIGLNQLMVKLGSLSNDDHYEDFQPPISEFHLFSSQFFWMASKARGLILFCKLVFGLILGFQMLLRSSKSKNPNFCKNCKLYPFCFRKRF